MRRWTGWIAGNVWHCVHCKKDWAVIIKFITKENDGFHEQLVCPRCDHPVQDENEFV